MLIEKLKKIVVENPNKIAYKIDNKKITYQDLWDLSLKYSNILKKQGNSPVIIYNKKSIDVVVLILSCLMSRRAYIPLDFSTPKTRIDKIKNSSNSNLVISKLEELDNINHYVDIKNNNEIAYIIFTSGTTGNPKGVPISYSNLDNFTKWISSLLKYENINVLNQASFSFDLSVADLYYSLFNGHTLVSIDFQNNTYEHIFKIIKEEKINLIVSTPTFMKLCLINPEFNQTNFESLKCIYFCGESLEKELVKKIFEKFSNIRIINAYGPTEATSAISAIEITRKMLDCEEILPVGDINNFATNVEIINDEIVLSGPSVFNGYINDKEKIIKYFTGDVGYVRDGKLYCKGRIDRQIKHNGYRIELDDIEANLKSIDSIEECAVIYKYDKKIIKAFVVTKKYNKIDDIKEKLQLMLPSYMIPKVIKIIEKMPINKNGK